MRRAAHARFLGSHETPPCDRPYRSVPLPTVHMLAVDIRNLTKSYGRVTAVKDLSLQMNSGEIVAFLGPNGAGKTTTIDMILGLARPDSGTVQVYGHSPVEAVERGEVSAVMQNGGLLKDFTVAETVAYTASLYAHARPVAEVLRSE